MGMKNMRAICPNCGGKIHTQPKGLGHVMLGANGVFTQTGKQCELCGVALTGRVDYKNFAVLARTEQPRTEPTPSTNPTDLRAVGREEYLRKRAGN